MIDVASVCLSTTRSSFAFGVTLEFERAAQFHFASTVSWPDGDNYDLVVENAVREALVQLQSAHTFACRLVGINWHTVDSRQSGFAFAAHHATRTALESIK
jgi:hypothetical protein